MNARLGLRIATFAVALAVGLLILSFVFLSGYRGPQYTVFKDTSNQSVSDGALRALGVVPCFLPQAALCFGVYALLCAWLVFGNDPVKRALYRLFSKKASDKALQA